MTIFLVDTFDHLCNLTIKSHSICNSWMFVFVHVLADPQPTLLVVTEHIWFLRLLVFCTFSSLRSLWMRHLQLSSVMSRCTTASAAATTSDEIPVYYH